MNCNISILSWNVHGLNNEKISDPLFLENVLNYEILIMTESWTHSKSKLKIPGYAVPFHKPASKKPKKKGRPSGGLVVYYSKIIKKGIDLVKMSKKENIIWIKLRKNFFNLPRDIYLCCAYILSLIHI